MVALTMPGGAAYAASKYDASGDTVTCNSLFSTIQIAPPLSPTGTQPTTVSIKGTLSGCTDGNGDLNLKGNPSVSVFTGSIKGTLSGASNSTATLIGCSTTSGSLSVKWNADANGEGLLNKASTFTLSHAFGATYAPTGGGFGMDNIPNSVYGAFYLGKAAFTESGGSCPAGSLAAGSSFSGGDGGTSSAAFGATSQDAVGLASGNANSATKSSIDLGLGAAYFG
jgi:hypothetical protein